MEDNSSTLKKEDEWKEYDYSLEGSSVEEIDKKRNQLNEIKDDMDKIKDWIGLSPVQKLEKLLKIEEKLNSI